MWGGSGLRFEGFWGLGAPLGGLEILEFPRRKRGLEFGLGSQRLRNH